MSDDELDYLRVPFNQQARDQVEERLARQDELEKMIETTRKHR